MKTTIKTRVWERPEPQRVLKEVPVIPGELLEESPYRIADELWELGVQEDQLVGAVLRDVPSGTEVRKITGEVLYRVADANWVRRELGIEDERIIMLNDRGSLSLWKPDLVVVVQLSKLMRTSQWDLIDDGLGDMRCPK